MAYSSLLELQNRYTEKAVLQLTDRDGDSSPDSAIIDSAIADADALIDGYIRTRYSLPLAATPPVLALCSQAIAWFYLHHGRAPDHVRQGYEDSLATLDRISSGRIDLDTTGTTDPLASSGGYQGTLDDDDRTFTKASLDGWF